MKEEKIKISVNQEDVQNIIDCYEKDIEYIKHLEEENKSLQSKLKEKEEAEKEFIKLLEDKWNESQDIWFIKLLNKYEEITSKQAKENDEILSKGENK